VTNDEMRSDLSLIAQLGPYHKGQGVFTPAYVQELAKHALTWADKLDRLDSILLNKEPECEPCEEIAVGRAQAYHEVREFLRTGKWNDIG